MKKLTFIFAMFALVTLVITSCEKEDQMTNDLLEIEKRIEVLATPDHLVDLQAELQSQGLDLITIAEPTKKDAIETIEGEKTYFERIDDNTKSVTYSPWVRISPTDLTKMTVNINAPSQPDFNEYRHRFAWRIGSGSTLPVGVYVNDYTIPGSSPSAVNPNPGQNWYCDRRLIVNTKELIEDNGQVAQQVPGTAVHLIPNYSDDEVTMEPMNLWSTTQVEEHSWWVAATAGIAVSGEVGLPFGIAGGSIEVSLSVEAGGGGSHSVETTNNFQSPYVDVPAGHYAQFTCKEVFYDKTYKYDCPMQFQGYVGSDYGPGKWNGSHFWAITASSFFVEHNLQQIEYTAKIRLKESHYVYSVADVYPLPMPGQ